MPAVQVNRPRLPGARLPVIKTKVAARVLSGEDDVKLNRTLTWDGLPWSPVHVELQGERKRVEVGQPSLSHRA